MQAMALDCSDDEIAVATAMAERQELVLRRQLRELHRLVSVQRQRKGTDPLTGEAVVDQGRSKTPHVLDDLPPLLDSQGGIASIGCVEGVVAIMRQTTAVDSTRKLLIVVLEKTKDKMPCLAKFVKIHGLGVLSTWLADAMTANRPQAVVQILRLLPRLPVTVNGLKDSGIGKLVNRLTKEKAGGDEELRKEAGSVLEGWKKLAKAKAAAGSASSPTSPAPARGADTGSSPPAGSDGTETATDAATPPAATVRSTAGTSAAVEAVAKVDTVKLSAKADRPEATDKKGGARARATAIRDNDMFGDSTKATGAAPAKKPKTAIRPDYVRARAERMKAGRMAAAAAGGATGTITRFQPSASACCCPGQQNRLVGAATRAVATTHVMIECMRLRAFGATLSSRARLLTICLCSCCVRQLQLYSHCKRRVERTAQVSDNSLSACYGEPATWNSGQ